MQDVFASKECTIGTTMTIMDKICPKIIRVDIMKPVYNFKTSYD